jgi:hypothetical protein
MTLSLRHREKQLVQRRGEKASARSAACGNARDALVIVVFAALNYIEEAIPA